jgi:hypothetical protein
MKFFLVLVFLIFHFSSYVFAQQESARSEAGTTAVASSIPAGIYHGRVLQTGGQMQSGGRPRSSDFVLDLSHYPGTLKMERADFPCNRALPIVITGTKDGVVRLEQSGVHGGITGCDRTFELTVSGKDLRGTLTIPSGNLFDAIATKQLDGLHSTPRYDLGVA